MRLTYAVEVSPRPYLPVGLVEGRIARAIEDSRLCFVRSDAVEEEGTNVPQDGAPLIT